jgi:hypothetical protein
VVIAGDRALVGADQDPATAPDRLGDVERAPVTSSMLVVTRRGFGTSSFALAAIENDLGAPADLFQALQDVTERLELRCDDDQIETVRHAGDGTRDGAGVNVQIGFFEGMCR